MEPVIEASQMEEASQRSFPDQSSLPPISRRTTGAGKPAPFTASQRSKGIGKDYPSLKYKDISEAVSSVVLSHARAPPRPTLPRRAGLRYVLLAFNTLQLNATEMLSEQR